MYLFLIIVTSLCFIAVFYVPFYKLLFYISVIYKVCIMRLFVYDMLVNVNLIYYVHVCEQARWARSAGNSTIENLCSIIITHYMAYIRAITIDYRSYASICSVKTPNPILLLCRQLQAASPLPATLPTTKPIQCLLVVVMRYWGLPSDTTTDTDCYFLGICDIWNSQQERCSD